MMSIEHVNAHTRRYINKYTTEENVMRKALLLTALIIAVAAVPAYAQTYGTGESIQVPWVEPGTITVDGQADEAAWENAVSVDPAANWDGDWTGHPDPDVGFDTRLLYTEDRLYVYHKVSDYAALLEPWADFVLLGLDFLHEAGVTDTLTDPGFGGFGENLPDGPVAYYIWPGNDSIPAFSQSFRTDVNPEEEGWVEGTFFFDEQTLEWGFEAAFIHENVSQGGEIGFNIGGAAGKEEGVDDRDGELAYAWHSWQVCDPETQENTFFCGGGGTIMSDAHSMATLELVAPGAGGDVYGTGTVLDVPYVSPNTITLDGMANESAWDNAATVDPAANWDGDWTGHPDPDVGFDSRLLYTEDRLYVYHKVSDYAVLLEQWADFVLVGLDFLHEAGVTDTLTDPGFGGFGENLPDGPVAYHIWPGNDSIPAFSQSFRSDVNPEAEGWVEGTFFFDEQTLEWGFEAAFIHENVDQGGEIGFNIGGAAGKEEGVDDRDGELAYAWHSWQVCDPDVQENTFFCGGGGTIMSDAHSMATLNLVPEGGARSDYGTGVTVTVPRVAPGTITIDGVADEGAWDKAATVDPAANWDGAWTGHPDPDVGFDTRLLYTDDRLYVYHKVSDYAVLLQPWADFVLLGLDFIHQAGVTDTLTDPGFGGFGENLPDGPVAYYIWAGNDSIPAFSQAFRTDVNPEEEGWVEGVFFFDEQTLEWGFEAAFIHENVSQGGEIGFNIGGAAGKEEGVDDRDGELAYAWHSWQVCDPETQENTFFCGGGGTIMSDAHSMATLVLGETVGIEEEKLDELPTEFALGQNYPNPFNPSTTIEYSLSRAATVSLDIFNILGQHVASLVDEPRTPGTYRLTWEAGNLSSGMYVYQLRIDGELVKSRKMMLIK